MRDQKLRSVWVCFLQLPTSLFFIFTANWIPQINILCDHKYRLGHIDRTKLILYVADIFIDLDSIFAADTG